jgi:hypothetical protein
LSSVLPGVIESPSLLDSPFFHIRRLSQIMLVRTLSDGIYVHFIC